MAVLRRLEKLRRYLRWRIGPRDALPVRWHVGRPNFGDDINPSFFGRIHGRSVRFASDPGQPHILGAGSILEHAKSASVVCGSGLLFPPSGSVPAGEIVAVRGALSAEACSPHADVLLGDPLVLIDAFVGPTVPRHRFGFVPHVTSVAHWRRCAASECHIINPAWSPWRTVGEIAACETIFSQSLHGLIVADALGIPNVWVAPGDGMSGGRFKFDDYFSTLERGKEPVRGGPDMFRAPERYDAEIGRYRFCKRRLRQALAAACDRVNRPGGSLGQSAVGGIDEP
jgi:pyruvyltransferase